MSRSSLRLRPGGSAARGRIWSHPVITDASQRSKVDPIESVEVLDIDELVAEAESAPPLAENVAVGGDGLVILIFTSGTTGKPKGVPVRTKAFASFHAYLHYSLDVADDDVFWNAADPGWAYGLYYALVGPLLVGHSAILVNAGFDPAQTLDIIRKYGVTNFAGAPTAYRAIRAAGLDAAVPLRRASSAGEPLTPDVIAWGRENFGIEIRDHYGQTELGMVICNHWDPEVARPLKPGSMGQPLPGYAAGVIDGQIAIDVANSPCCGLTDTHRTPPRAPNGLPLIAVGTSPRTLVGWMKRATTSLVLATTTSSLPPATASGRSTSKASS